jgi:hypothetical protein
MRDFIGFLPIGGIEQPLKNDLRRKQTSDAIGDVRMATLRQPWLMKTEPDMTTGLRRADEMLKCERPRS